MAGSRPTPPTDLSTIIPLAARQEALKYGLVSIITQGIMEAFKIKADLFFKPKSGEIDFRRPTAGFSSLFSSIGGRADYNTIEKRIKNALKAALKVYFDNPDAADADVIYEFCLGPAVASLFRSNIAENIITSSEIFERPAPIPSALASPRISDTIIVVYEDKITEPNIKAMIEKTKVEFSTMKGKIAASIVASAVRDLMSTALPELMTSESEALELLLSQRIEERTRSAATGMSSAAGGAGAPLADGTARTGAGAPTSTPKVALALAPTGAAGGSGASAPAPR